MKNEENNNTDDLFKNAFEQFKVTPPKRNWEEIEEAMDAKFDEQFKDNLQPLKVRPEAHIWKNIQKELPLHAGAKRYIGWMTRIAAVLVIGMLLAILSDQQRQNQTMSEQSTTPVPAIEENIASVDIQTTEEENNEFVFEVDKDNLSGKSKRKSQKAEEAEIKNLLKFILDDDEDLAEVADDEVIKASLKPLEAPEDAVALARLEEQNDETIDLEIKIPLIVVETAQEAANLIEIYESSQQKSYQVD